MSNVKFNPKVIEYDRYQPEFYEDTKLISAKELPKKVKNALKIYKNKFLIDKVENEFSVEKGVLALMYQTNLVNGQDGYPVIFGYLKLW